MPVVSPLLALTWTLSALPAGAGAAQEDPMESRCNREILELHQFFEDWFNAALPATDDGFARFASVIADGFVIVSPAGRSVERASLISGLRDGHGRWQGHRPASRIWIENVRVHRVLPAPAGGGDLAIATYEEWQETGGGEDGARTTRGRLSTVIFRTREGTPNGVEWLHVHETWLSDDDG